MIEELHLGIQYLLQAIRSDKIMFVVTTVGFRFYASSVKRLAAGLATNKDTVDAISNASCEDCSRLTGTVKAYDRHLILCSNSSTWPSAVEKISPIMEMNNALESIKKTHKLSGQKSFKVRITACDLERVSDDLIDVIVYPDNKIFHVSLNTINEFADAVLSRADLQDIKIPNSGPSWKRLILTCTHNARDKRCGVAGPQVIQEIKSQLKQMNIPESEVSILGSSHIGGHEFAGTMIVYPEADWYGYIRKDRVRELLSNILNGNKYEKCWRGNPNFQW